MISQSSISSVTGRYSIESFHPATVAQFDVTILQGQKIVSQVTGSNGSCGVVSSGRLGSLVYGRQSQMAKSGQQKLEVGQWTRWEPLGQFLASAGVADKTAAVPATAATTITKQKSFLAWRFSRGA